MMMIMNTLTSPRLTLEPLREAHAAEMFAVLSDPAIYEYENEPPASVEALAARYRRQQLGRSPDGREQWLNWVARLSASGEAIGYVQATIYPDGHAGTRRKPSGKRPAGKRASRRAGRGTRPARRTRT